MGKNKRRRKNTNTSEVPYDGEYQYIKELNMKVKLKKGVTIKHWIARYLINQPLRQHVLFKKYGIDQEFLSDNDIHSVFKKN